MDGGDISSFVTFCVRPSAHGVKPQKEEEFLFTGHTPLAAGNSAYWIYKYMSPQARILLNLPNLILLGASFVFLKML